MYKFFVKFTFDFTLTGIGLIVLSPLLLFLVLLLTLANEGKVFFYQERLGKDSRVFRLYKFKTMNDQCDKKGLLLSDSERVTRVGHLIRSLSLDELPQLWNVLKGDMSLIGPRPLLPKYLSHYTTEQNRRHEVRPGITGWAQVNGRNSISWEKKFEYDVWYVDNISFWLDLKIIYLTIRKVILREGINAGEGVTMGEFKGSVERRGESQESSNR